MIKVYAVSKLTISASDPRVWGPGPLTTLYSRCCSKSWSSSITLEPNKVYFRLGLCYKEVDLSKL